MDLWRKWLLVRIIKKFISKNFNIRKIYIYIYNKKNIFMNYFIKAKIYNI